MSFTIAYISRELDFSAAKVAKSFVFMHHQRPNVISPKWWAIPERGPTGGLAIPLDVVTRS